MFAPADLERILSETNIRTIDYHDELASTNDHALRDDGVLGSDLPRLVIASRQTEGRGRQGNQWWSADGALTFSVVIDLATWNLPTEHVSQIALWTGLGVRDALAQVVAHQPVRLKWPNDVFVDNKKVCGILVESTSRTPRRVVIGVGINANNRISDAPHGDAGWANPATSVRESTGIEVPLVDLLTRVLRGMSDAWDVWATSRGGLRQLWEPHCLLQGQHIVCTNGPRTDKGLCHGVDDEGYLLIEVDGSIHRLLGGTITHFS